MSDSTSNGLLQVAGLNITFPSPSGPVRTTDDVHLELGPGGSTCLVGESGCGKSILALAVMRLLPPQARIRGRIVFMGRNILEDRASAMQSLRGRRMAMIFEQPTSCLNPVLPVGRQIAEAVRVHEACSRREARTRAMDLMALTGIAASRQSYRQYPHELSGGMAQRAMIAMALAFSPDLLIADEPTTALDPAIQAQIVELIRNLTERFNTALLLITHDLNVAAELCSEVAVMYAGQILETGILAEVMDQPRHPYTQALADAARGDRLRLRPGSPPELSRPPAGCRFHPRCPHADDRCRRQTPPLEHGVRCHLEKLC